MDNKRNKRELKAKNELYNSCESSRFTSEAGLQHQVHLPQLLPKFGGFIGELRDQSSSRKSFASIRYEIDANAVHIALPEVS
jgi:hypothetical protein